MINLIDWAKFLFRKDKELYSALYDITGFYPRNIEIYRIAFTHKSQEYHSRKSDRPLNNERLEFLGDAVLEAVVSDIVYHHFPRKREGFLTNTRSKIVQRETLGRLAKEMGIEALVKSHTHSSAHNSYLGGNAFEALIGAIYLDRGYKAAFRFVEKRVMGRAIDIDGVAHKEVNFKSKLLEWSQKNRISCDFKLDENTTRQQSNAPTFHTIVSIEGLQAGEGKGFSKKESQQNAAKEALTKLRREPQFIDAIFHEKEKRTAMEADQFFVLPKIDEIEQGIALDEAARQKAERRAERRNRRNDAKTEARKAQADTTENATERPAREKARPKAEKQEQRTPKADKPRREKAAQPAEGATPPATRANTQHKRKPQAEKPAQQPDTTPADTTPAATHSDADSNVAASTPDAGTAMAAAKEQPEATTRRPQPAEQASATDNAPRGEAPAPAATNNEEAAEAATPAPKKRGTRRSTSRRAPTSRATQQAATQGDEGGSETAQEAETTRQEPAPRPRKERKPYRQRYRMPEGDSSLYEEDAIDQQREDIIAAAEAAAFAALEDE